jgi:hypothetical protein
LRLDLDQSADVVRASPKILVALIQLKSKRTGVAHHADEKKESAMPTESILYVTFVVAALTLFAVALAYAEWATRHASGEVSPRERRAPKTPLHREDADVLRKAA